MLFKRILIIIVMALVLGQHALTSLASPIDIETLSKIEISKLTDSQLFERYIDVLVEIETAKTFYGRAGFQPKEVKNFKELLRYRMNLVLEMHKRKIKPPKFE